MLSREEVLKIAHLARLSLSEEELVLYQQRLGRVLDYIHELNALETSKDAFVRHVPKDAEGLRDDVAVPFADNDLLTGNAPEALDRCFLLPAIMDSE